MTKKYWFAKCSGLIAGCVLGATLAPVAEAQGGPGGPPGPRCKAEKPEEFLCSCEYDPGPPASGKWTSITVTSSAVRGSVNCLGDCIFSYSIDMTAGSASYGTYDLLGAGQLTFNSTTPSHTISNNSLTIECGTEKLVDVSYQAGECPSSMPDGPGACSVVAITFRCGPDC